MYTHCVPNEHRYWNMNNANINSCENVIGILLNQLKLDNIICHSMVSLVWKNSTAHTVSWKYNRATHNIIHTSHGLYSMYACALTLFTQTLTDRHTAHTHSQVEKLQWHSSIAILYTNCCLLRSNGFVWKRFVSHSYAPLHNFFFLSFSFIAYSWILIAVLFLHFVLRSFTLKWKLADS